jgi:hypothetical protein
MCSVNDVSAGITKGTGNYEVMAAQNLIQYRSKTTEKEVLKYVREGFGSRVYAIEVYSRDSVFVNTPFKRRQTQAAIIDSTPIAQSNNQITIRVILTIMHLKTSSCNI